MPEKSSPKGLVFSVSRGSTEDGPGIHTVVFFKGCPLHCIWCHSPQSQGSLTPLLTFYQSRCIGCGACVKVCANGAQNFLDGKRIILREKCTLCGRCTEVCPSSALEITGRWMGVPEVMKVVRRDSAYYRASGGGVTFSGGEPLMQPDFLAACLKECRREKINTAIETCGFTPWRVIKPLLSDIDLFLYDIKSMDEKRHLELTGVSNKPILENLRRIGDSGGSIWIRLPLIPGLNDGETNISAVADFVQTIFGIKKVSLLPYNVAAGARYQEIGKPYTLEGLQAQPKGYLKTLVEIFERKGIKAEAGR